MGDTRLVIVSGKGGVGKSTVAAALALAASRRGLATVVVEVAGRRDVAGLLEQEAADGVGESEIEPGLHHATVDRQAALEEYLHQEVHGALPAAILARSKTFSVFVEATPGMGELLTIGKVWELAQRPRRRKGATQYDLVVLDAPASGQLMGMLTAPTTFRSIARVGPVAHQAAAVERLISDRDSMSVLAVTTPEQMAVTETLGMAAELRRRFSVELSAVAVNRMFPSRFSSSEASQLRLAADEPAVRSALWLASRNRTQRAQAARLRHGLDGVPLTTLPFLFTPELGRAEVLGLANNLARWLR